MTTKRSYLVTPLTEADIPRILELERKVCIPEIQVTEERLIKRFQVGNFMLGLQKAKDERTLIGSVGFRLGQFDPEDREGFCTNFPEFSTPNEKPAVWNSCFCYSFNVDPKERTAGRGLLVCRMVLLTMRRMVKQMNCQYIVADGRPSSYNGSNKYPDIEVHHQIPAFKKALDDHLQGGAFPPDEIVFLEPTWAVYRFFLRNMKAIWVIPNFFPSDVPAGGLRVILYGEI